MLVGLGREHAKVIEKVAKQGRNASPGKRLCICLVFLPEPLLATELTGARGILTGIVRKHIVLFAVRAPCLACFICRLHIAFRQRSPRLWALRGRMEDCSVSSPSACFAGFGQGMFSQHCCSPGRVRRSQQEEEQGRGMHCELVKKFKRHHVVWETKE